jgi:hypothetical protein
MAGFDNNGTKSWGYNSSSRVAYYSSCNCQDIHHVTRIHTQHFIFHLIFIVRESIKIMVGSIS